MGHAEMLLAVAGLDEARVQDLTRRLAAQEWDSFAPLERAAFHAGWQLSRAPHEFDDAQRAALAAACGAERAVDVIWHVAWGNYMMLVADTLQLPLERENAFRRAPEASRAAAGAAGR
jgi:alkylhydroperoxidase family enzyme